MLLLAQRQAVKSYGLELLFQQKLYKGFYGILAYTIGVSEFEDKNGDLIPSSWDSRHTISLTGGKRFKNNLEVGVKWRYQSALPITPIAANADLVAVWNVNARALPNYDLLNSQRGGTFHALDLRIDKKWFFKNWSLNLFLDVQNIYGFKTEEDILILDKDDMNSPVILNPTDLFQEQRYRTKFITTTNGTTLPTLGIIVEI